MTRSGLSLATNGQARQAPSPVVFIHGLIGTLQLPDMTAAFAPGRALAPDLLGYGTQREVPPEAIDLPAQVEHLQRLIERHFPGEAVHLVGHSVGGVVAMLFAQTHGQQVLSLVSVEGNFSLDDAFWSATLARMPAAEACAMLGGFRADPAAWLARAERLPSFRAAPHGLGTCSASV